MGSRGVRNPSKENKDAEECRNERKDKDDPEVICHRGQEQGSEERPHHGACMVHGSLKAEGLSPFVFWNALGKQGVTGRSPHPFSDPVKETEKKDVEGRGRQSDKRTCDRRSEER